MNRLSTLLGLLFVGSGAVALMDQLVWQRMLFTVIGVDLESVTVVISVFMLGLGLGGLLADACRGPGIELFI